jgi:uncharacterized YigZ family protein
MKPILEYRTVSGSNQHQIKEKNSVFISHIHPVKNETEIETTIIYLKKKYPDATHYCYAYKLLDGKSKFADDGEPHRTAGLRIMNAIDHFKLTNVLVVVIRYYGGIKLGVGPLGKAYYDAAISAVNHAGLITLILHKKYLLSYDFTFDSVIRRFFNSNKIKITKENYSSFIECECLIVFSDEQKIVNQLKELTKGKIQIQETDETAYIN